MKLKVTIPLIASLLLTAILKIVQKKPWITTLSNSLFLIGLTLVIIGLWAIVDIIGLFKSFTYLFYKKKINRINKDRINDGLDPIPVLDMFGFLQTREHMPFVTLFKFLLAGIISWILSYILSIYSL